MTAQEVKDSITKGKAVLFAMKRKARVDNATPHNVGKDARKRNVEVTYTAQDKTDAQTDIDTALTDYKAAVTALS